MEIPKIHTFYQIVSGRTDKKITPEIKVRWLNISISLRVGEIGTDDTKGFGENSVAIDGAIAEELNLETGNYVRIQGESETIAQFKHTRPADHDLGIIRIPQPVRHKAQVSLGGRVKVDKVEIEEAEKVKIAPAESDTTIQINKPDAFKKTLLGNVVIEDGITKVSNDASSSSGFFGDVFDQDEDDFASDLDFLFSDTRFQVLETEKGGAVEITESTELKIEETAPEPPKDKPEDVLTEENFVQVETEPELDEKYELSAVEDLDKLDDRIGKSIFLISKFESEDENIYFTEDHFFKWNDE